MKMTIDEMVKNILMIELIGLIKREVDDVLDLISLLQAEGYDFTIRKSVFNSTHASIHVKDQTLPMNGFEVYTRGCGEVEITYFLYAENTGGYVVKHLNINTD